MNAKNKVVATAFDKLAKQIGTNIRIFEMEHGLFVDTVTVHHMDDSGCPVITITAGLQGRSGEVWAHPCPTCGVEEGAEHLLPTCRILRRES